MLRLLLYGVVSLAMAQDTIIMSTSTGNASPGPSPATTSQSVTHTVNVGKGGHTMDPDVTLAQVGDIIEFNFYPTNHSVIRAEYGDPCVPYEMTGVNKFGFFSGFHPVDARIPILPKYSVRVNDTTPIFYYCGAPGSCIGHQMVGVINPNATTSLVRQKELAAKSSFMLLPGEPWPSEEDTPFLTPDSAATSASVTTQPTVIATATTAAQLSHSHPGLSVGAIAGVAIGAAAVALIAAVLLYFCGRQSRRSNQPPMQRHEQNPFSPSGMISPFESSKHISLPAGSYSPPIQQVGYLSPHDITSSPPLRPMFVPSDMHLPPPTSPSPSPSPLHVMTAYNSNSNLYPSQNMYVELPSDSQVHLAPWPLARERPATADTVTMRSDTPSEI